MSVLRTLVLASGLALSCGAANAVTIKVTSGASSATATDLFSGTVNGFRLALSGASTSNATSAGLFSNTISLNGVGSLLVTFEDSFAINPASTVFTSFASVSNAALDIVVSHFVDFGSGFVSLANFDFNSTQGAMTDVDTLASDGTFTLRSVYSITTSASDTFANVNGDIQAAAVPVPAAGLMLLAGLGGLAAVRRRKTTA